MLINIIVKSIVKSIVYLSFWYQYDNDTFDTVYSPTWQDVLIMSHYSILVFQIHHETKYSQ